MKQISKPECTKGIDWCEASIEEMVAEGYFDSVEEAKEFILKAINSPQMKKQQHKPSKTKKQRNRIDGIIGINPKIKKISFELRGKMNIILDDGRIIIVPLFYFPSIQRLSANQRKKWCVIDDSLFSFNDCNEIFHIEQVLGKEKDYKFRC